MLTQDQINQIVKLNGGMWTDPQTGRVYMPQYSGGSEAAPPELQGFIGSDVATNNGFSVGTPVSHYDLSGAKGMSYNVPEPEPMFSGVGDFLKSIAPVVLAAVGMNYAFPTSGGSLSSLPLDVGGGGSGADMGAFGGGGDVPGVFNAAKDSQLANEALGLGANSAFSGGVTLGGASGGGGGFGSLGTIGQLATAAGGLLGATQKPPTQKNSQRMDPRMDEYVYGGLLPRVNTMYQGQLDPNSQYQKDRLALKNKARGLLGI